MERIPRKKRKRRVLSNLLIAGSALIVLALIVVYLSFFYTDINQFDGVTVPKLEFDHEKEGVYVKFNAYNPEYEDKSCVINIHILDDVYKSRFNVSARSRYKHRELVDMPNGTTEVRMDYVCS